MKAIVLSRRDFREYDQIISVYTEETGKREVLAKGIKKIVSKNAAHLEPCFLVDIEIVPGKEIDHVTKAIAAHIFAHIRDDVKKSMIAQYIVSLVHKMTDVEQADRRVYYLLLETLEWLEKNKGSQMIIDLFVIRFFSLLGMQPELSQCVVCGREDDLMQFSYSGGGVICSSCAAQRKERGEIIHPCPGAVRDRLIAFLYSTYERAFMWEESEAYQHIHQIIRTFAQFHTDKKIEDWGKLPL